MTPNFRNLSHFYVDHKLLSSIEICCYISMITIKYRAVYLQQNKLIHFRQNHFQAVNDFEDGLNFCA